jgi:hypothetical protein
LASISGFRVDADVVEELEERVGQVVRGNGLGRGRVTTDLRKKGIVCDDGVHLGREKPTVLLP